MVKKIYIIIATLFLPLITQAQNFQYGAEGLQPLQISQKIDDNTSIGRISEGIIEFLKHRYTNPADVLISYDKNEDSERFLIQYNTGVKYLQMGVIESFGNMVMTLELISYDSCFQVKINSAQFDKNGKITSALQKNSSFYKHNGKVRYDTNQGEDAEIDLHLYFDIFVGEVREYINRENRKDR